MIPEPILATVSLVKTFPGVRALDDVDFELRSGEIHAVLGENGAGKSTLIKILGGVYQQDSGHIILDGAPVAMENPRAALLRGIRVIHQELNILPQLSVAENIFLGNLPTGRAPGSVDWNKLQTESRKILTSFDAKINPSARAGILTPGQQQVVEIAQALTSDIRILIMDEPTSALNEQETENLFQLLRKMSNQGIAIIYITHKIYEVFKIAHRVTVLRDGKKVSTVAVSETEPAKLIQMMVGRSLTEMYQRTHTSSGQVVFETRSLYSHGLTDINLRIAAGEVVGIYGVLGSGRTRLANTLFGITPLTAGEIYIDGNKVSINSPFQAKRLGIGYVPAERKTEALIMPLSLRKNLTISSLSKYMRNFLLVDEPAEKESCQSWIKALEIRSPNPDVNVGSLSGGNQQKVVFSRWLDTHAKILILNEPTRGVDVGAKTEIYRLIDTLCKDGHAILMFSSEMPELIGVADRIMVMSAGRITGEFMHWEATQEKLMECALAGHSGAEAELL